MRFWVWASLGGRPGVGLSGNPLQPEARVLGCEQTEVRAVKESMASFAVLPRVLGSSSL